jgi:SAM-dependent methyltransferase
MPCLVTLGDVVTDITAEIDRIKAYWDRRPCNIRHSEKEVGSRAYFDDVEARKYFVEPHIPRFADFPRWTRKQVLEIGCGIGTDAVNFARAGADYTGLELSPVSLELTRKRFELYGLNSKLIEGNAEKLDALVPAGRFDLIYSFGVIHHTPNPRAVIAAARRSIADEGILKIMLYARNSWKAAMIAEGLDQPEAQSGCPLAATYSAEDVRELLAGCFEVTDLRQAHIFPYKIEEYVHYRYEKQPWFQSMPAAVFEALERHFGWHLLITARPI